MAAERFRMTKCPCKEPICSKWIVGDGRFEKAEAEQIIASGAMKDFIEMYAAGDKPKHVMDKMAIDILTMMSPT